MQKKNRPQRSAAASTEMRTMDIVAEQSYE